MQTRKRRPPRFELCCANGRRLSGHPVWLSERGCPVWLSERGCLRCFRKRSRAGDTAWETGTETLGGTGTISNGTASVSWDDADSANRTLTWNGTGFLGAAGPTPASMRRWTNGGACA